MVSSAESVVEMPPKFPSPTHTAGSGLADIGSERVTNRNLNPCVLSYMASYDVWSNICHGLGLRVQYLGLILHPTAGRRSGRRRSHCSVPDGPGLATPPAVSTSAMPCPTPSSSRPDSKLDPHPNIL